MVESDFDAIGHENVSNFPHQLLLDNVGSSVRLMCDVVVHSSQEINMSVPATMLTLIRVKQVSRSADRESTCSSSTRRSA